MDKAGRWVGRWDSEGRYGSGQGVPESWNEGASKRESQWLDGWSTRTQTFVSSASGPQVADPFLISVL